MATTTAISDDDPSMREPEQQKGGSLVPRSLDTTAEQFGSCSDQRESEDISSDVAPRSTEGLHEQDVLPPNSEDKLAHITFDGAAESTANAKITSPSDDERSSSRTEKSNATDQKRITETRRSTRLKTGPSSDATSSSKRTATSEHSEDEIVIERPVPKSAKRITASVAAIRPKRQGKTSARSPATPKAWKSPHVVTSARSPLVGVDITTLLQQDEAWDVLSAEAQLRLLTLLDVKDPEKMGSKYKNYAKTLFEESDKFLEDISAFEEDLAAGRLEPKWQSDAMKAGEMRARGELDNTDVEDGGDVEKAEETKEGKHMGDDKLEHVEMEAEKESTQHGREAKKARGAKDIAQE